MRHKILGYVFITAVVASIVSVGYYWQVSNQPISEFFFPQIKQGQKAEPYTNTEFGFQFNYDKKYKLDVSGSQANFFKHEAKSLVSASIPKSFYPKTNFGSANLTVAIQPHSQKSSCSVSAKTVEVNGTTFHVSEQDGAAAGTHYQTKIYRAFHSQDCLEVSLTMGIANIDNFDAGTVTEVNQNNIWDRLNQMLLTFKFADSKPSPNPAASSKTQGILMGHVFIGHNCPVQRAGIPCPPSPEALAATQIIVYKPDGVTVVASTYPKPEAAGSTSQLDTYSFSLLPGNYLVDYKSSAGFFKGHAPQPVTITAGKTTTLDFNIDTGIR